MNLNDTKLVLVGSGIKSISHITRESEAFISQSDVVLSLINEPVMKKWVHKNAKKYIDLSDLYFSKKLRADSYNSISEYILETLNKYKFVCVVIYGHPTAYAQPGLQAIKEASRLGSDTAIYPGISAEDCLFADLEINPSSCGCYSVEATDFLLYNRLFDKSSHLIIWQIGMIGNYGHENQQNEHALKLLKNKLLNFYPKSHPIFLYEASLYPGLKSKIVKEKLVNIECLSMTTISTLYVPPLENFGPCKIMKNELGL